MNAENVIIIVMIGILVIEDGTEIGTLVIDATLFLTNLLTDPLRPLALHLIPHLIETETIEKTIVMKETQKTLILDMVERILKIDPEELEEASVFFLSHYP